MSSMLASAVLYVLVLFPNDAPTIKVLNTQGSVTIQEAAGISVLNTAPLQLILSNDSGMWIGAPPVSQSSTGSGLALDKNLTLGEGGLFASIAAPGQVLSVTVGDTEAVETVSGNRFKRIIAQFN